MNRILPVFFLLCAGAFHLQAQSIGIVPNSLQISVNQRPFSSVDTIQTGDSLTYQITFVNNGPVTINTPIDLIVQGTDSTVRDTLFDPLPSDSMGIGSTKTRTYEDMVDVADRLYMSDNGGGAIVVVVWPTVRLLPNVQVTDSGRITLVRDYPLSIKNTLGEGLVLYPNPSSDKVYMLVSAPNMKVDHVRIIDGLGRSCLHIPNPETSIDIGELSSGKYWVHLKFSDGSTAIRNFIKK